MSAPRPTLALDLSLSTGWACGADGVRPCWGTWKLPKTSQGLGKVNSCLANELEAAISVHKPQRVVFEAPFVQSDRSARLLIYLCGVVELVCFEREVPCFEANVMAVRKAVLGSGRPKSTDPRNNKQPMIQWCFDHDWLVSDDDQADALVLLTYAHQVTRRRAAA